MVTDTMGMLALILVSTTSILLVVSSGKRVTLGILAVQYLGMFLLVRMEWSPPMAAVKLVGGWIACAILGMAILSLPEQLGSIFPRRTLKDVTQHIFNLGPSRLPLGRLFNFFAALLMLFAAFSIARNARLLLVNAEIVLLQAAFVLIGLGFLKIGFHTQPYHMIVGLLTTLSGFEILYALVDSSALVAGLLAGVNLGLAFIGAYLIFSPEMEHIG